MAPSRWAAAALAAALALGVVLAAQPISHDDVFWHLAAGERMLDEGRVLKADPFSYTRAGERWVTHEWGFSVLLAALAAAGGLGSLVVLRAVLVALFLALVAAAAWRRAGPAAAPAAALLALLLAAAAWGVAGELILRAALAGAVLFAAALLGLDRFRRRPTWPIGAGLAALFLLWANLHSGVIFGLALVGLAAAEAVLLPPPAGGPGRLRSAAPHLALLAATSLAALATPNGLAALAYPFRIALLVGDPASGFTAGHFTGGWRGRQALLGLLVAALLAGLLVAVRRRRPLPPAATLAAAGLFAVLSWRTDRLALELVAVAVPAAFALWAPQLAAGGRAAGRALTVTAAATAAVSLLLAGTVVAFRPPGVISPLFPSAAAAFLEREVLPATGGPSHLRLFHHQNWGGYLHWRLGVPVFWDGRNDVFAPVVREVTTTPFPRVVERYGIESLLLSPREYRDLAPLLADGSWPMVYADQRAAVFLRRSAWPRLAEELALDRTPTGRRSPGRLAAPPVR